MFSRAVVMFVLLYFFVSLMALPTLTTDDVKSLSAEPQNQYTYSGLRVGVRNLIETAARNTGRTLLKDSVSDNTLNLLDYSKSESLMRPKVDREGYWIGAPTLLHTSDNQTYIFYRFRDSFRRGWKVGVAKIDEKNITPVWEMTKYDYKEVRSLEGAALDERNGTYSLFLSYQEEGTGEWSINHLKAEKPSEFDFRQSEKLNLEFENYPHFKDPILYRDKLIVHATSRNFLRDTNLVTQIPFNGTIEEISIGPAHYSGNRITSLVDVNGTDIVFFDHKKNIVFTGEEKGKLGILTNSTHVRILNNISMTSEHSTKSLRYVSAFKNGDKIVFYYESALPGRGHELRKAEMSLSKFADKLGLTN